MTETVRGTRIVDVEGVAVPVRDQDRALRFYVDKLGFDIRRDVPMADGSRWIQVAPPAARTTVALVASGGKAPVGLDTGITFTTRDAEADHADLMARGVDVDELLRWPGVPAMFAFRDQDGNGLKIIENT
jgi:lactoylglutathione lyase